MTQVAVIGAGFAGLSAAYDLARAGVAVTVFEAAPETGGLAAGFRAEGWDWPLEKYYHHIFQSDDAIIGLVDELNARDMLFFSKPVSAFWDAEHRWLPLDGALPLLRYPRLPFVDRVRMGAVLAWMKFLKATNRWQHLERIEAERYLRRTMGDRGYEQIWQQLFQGKFGAYASDVNAAWFWSRIAARTPKLGYFRGGFQSFTDRLAEKVRELGGTIHLGTPVQAMQPQDGRWLVASSRGMEHFDAVLSTTSPSLLRRMAPALPNEYTVRLEQLRSIGAVVLTVALDQSLTDNVYWLNMDLRRFPFLALVEHTQMIDRRHYNNQHIVYLGNYLDPNHAHFSMNAEEILEEFLPSLSLVNPRFQRSWIQGCWMNREAYAQPVVPVNHSSAIPPLATPLNGLWWASMSQVYPWDRGTNFAVEIGRKAAREILQHATGSVSHLLT